MASRLAAKYAFTSFWHNKTR